MLTSRAPEEAIGAIGRMINACRHRGPDGTGEICIPLPGGTKHLVLGHARLSIIDLTDSAAQPMHDPATDSWLIYNGEIYNFLDLRRKLEKAGYTFSSTGDTEVLLKALIEWGEDCLADLRGMYAFALWDGRRKRLVLGRDPLGIKPLLISRQGDTLLFASEFRALRESGFGRFTLNPAAIASYLTYGAVIEPLTMARECFVMPPGSVVIVDPEGKSLPPRRFLSVGDFVRGPREHHPPLDFKTAREELSGELARSVKAHLVSDVPVGIFLSGGIDSSILAALVNRSNVTQDITYLTVGFPEQDFSEVEYAKIVAQKLRGRHEVINLAPGDLSSLLPKALEAVDQPTVDGINTYAISRVAASSGLKVLLSGLGGDEVFGGYTTFWKTPILSRHPILISHIARVWQRMSIGNVAQWHKLARSAKMHILRDAYLLHRSIRWKDATSYLPLALIPPDNPGIPPETLSDLSNAHDEQDFFQIAFLEMSFYMRNQLLRDADIFGSANSVEIRVPFLDIDLIRNAFKYPPSFHMTLLGQGKKITRSVLREMHPDLHLGRRKMGFLLPWKHWLRQPLYDMVASTLSDRDVYRGLGLDQQDGARALRSFSSGDPLVPWAQVWSLFVLLNWQQKNNLPA